MKLALQLMLTGLVFSAGSAIAELQDLIQHVGVSELNENEAKELLDQGTCKALAGKVESILGSRPDLEVAKVVRKHLDFQGANAFAITAYNSKKGGHYREVTVSFYPLICTEVENKNDA